MCVGLGQLAMLKKQVKQRRWAERGAAAALILRQALFAAVAGRRLLLAWNRSGAGVRQPRGGAAAPGGSAVTYDLALSVSVAKASFGVIII